MIKTITNKTSTQDILDIIVESKFLCVRNEEKVIIYGNSSFKSPDSYESVVMSDVLFIKIKINNMNDNQGFAKVLFNLRYINAYKDFVFKVYPLNGNDFSDENISSLYDRLDEYIPKELSIAYGKDNSFFGSDIHTVTFDITNIIRDVNTVNPEVIFAIKNNYDLSMKKLGIFYPEENGSETCIGIITENDGLDKRYKYDEYSLGVLGNLFLNLKYGSNIYTNNLYSSSSINIPINFSIFYNKKLNDTNFPSGFGHNFGYYLFGSEEENSNIVFLMDPTGKKGIYQLINYTNNQEIFKLLELQEKNTCMYFFNYEDSSYIVISVNGMKIDIRINYIDGSSMTFNKTINGVFVLTSIENSLGDVISIEYSGLNIERIYNSDEDELLFFYNGDNTINYVDFTKENKQIAFRYNDGYMCVSILNVTYRASSSSPSDETKTEPIYNINIYFDSNGINTIYNNDTRQYFNIVYYDKKVKTIEYINPILNEKLYLYNYIYQPNLTTKVDFLFIRKSDFQNL